MTFRLSTLLRWSLITALLLLILTVVIEVISFPTVITTAGVQATVYLILFVLALFIYSWFALFHTRAATRAAQIALQTGTLWGLFCAAAWVIELLVANVIRPGGGSFYLVLYDGSAFTGFLLPGLASFLAAVRSRQFQAGLQAGVLTGMLGAVAIFLAFFLFSTLLLQTGQSDPQTLREFAQSGLPDLKTYIIGDYLAGMIAHLWIGLATGFFLGLLGGLGGKVLFR
ncbi:MAG TPA: hypothetical protein VF458_20250 [Ktedonobacteraceae bacterium]